MNGKWTRTAAVAALATALAAVPATAVTTAQAKTRKVECREGYQLYEKLPRRLRATWSRRATNHGGSADTYELTVTSSGTVESRLSKSVSSSVGGGWGPFQASVEGQFGSEAVKSKETSKGERYTLRVPPRRSIRVRYGVWTNRYKGLVLSRTNPEPGFPPRLWPVIPPPSCHLYIVHQFTATVATSDAGFDKSKPQRVND